MLRWNSDDGAIEIEMNKVKLGDISIPKISILPDYCETIKKHRLVTKTISIIAPKIGLGISDDFKKISINPDFEKGENNKAFLEPLMTFSNMENLLDNGVIVKVINADVSVFENGINWKFKNVCCTHKVGKEFPQAISFVTLIPEQKYVSSINLTKSNVGNRSTYDVKIESVNPFNVNLILTKRNIPLDNKIFAILDGHNLPVSGTLKLDFEGTKFIGGRFDLMASAGAIKLPLRNILSMNLGKRIDSGSISGSFSEKNARIDSINVSYADAGLQLTGIDIPLDEFKLQDTANICGTLSLTNINVQEMETILPESISRSAATVFKNYLPGFRLDFFKIDLNGTMAFDSNIQNNEINIGHGAFKIRNAEVPIGSHIITNVDATGIVSDDGFDIKLTNAIFKKTKVNNGTFFISNKDNSWIGKVNATITIDDALSCIGDISLKLATLPFEKMDLKGNVNLDMKLMRVEDDKQLKNDLPFRIVEGDCIIKSGSSEKELRLLWDSEKLSLNGAIATGHSSISIKIHENLTDGSGNSEFIFNSNSAFLRSFLSPLIPDINSFCQGNYILKINSSRCGKSEEYDVDLNLDGATLILPLIGETRFENEDGHILAHILDNGENFDFSKILLNAKNNKIKGKMTFDREGNLQKCSFDEFKINGNSAKINILRDKDNMLCSIIGDKLDVRKVFSRWGEICKNAAMSIYVNLEEVIMSGIHKIRNVKGSFDMKNGKIVGGNCYGVVGKDNTTLAMVTKNIDGTNNTIVSLSGSDTGKLLKYFGITDTIIGGSICIAIKSSDDAASPVTGSFEMSNFTAKNNTNLLKLISLSSTNLLSSSDDILVGFNFCGGNFVFDRDQIVIENGRAISPIIGISFDGRYDRMNDDFDINGIIVPIAAAVNNQHPKEILASDFYLTGSVGKPKISVEPLRYMFASIVHEKFGGALPKMQLPMGEVGVNDQFRNTISDPFLLDNFEANSAIKAPMRHRIDEKCGVKITRGVSK